MRQLKLFFPRSKIGVNLLGFEHVVWEALEEPSYPNNIDDVTSIRNTSLVGKNEDPSLLFFHVTSLRQPPFHRLGAARLTRKNLRQGFGELAVGTPPAPSGSRRKRKIIDRGSGNPIRHRRTVFGARALTGVRNSIVWPRTSPQTRRVSGSFWKECPGPEQRGVPWQEQRESGLVQKF